MLQAIRKRMDRDESGFTLIELMVVVLIIAILIAIAIPTFLGARTKSQDRAAEANTTNAALTGKTFYTDSETFLSGADTTSTAAAYAALEPSLTWDTTGSVTTMGVMVATATEVVLATKSKSGKWVCAVERSDGPSIRAIQAAATVANPYTTKALCAAGPAW